MDPGRRREWRRRLADGPLSGTDSFALLDAYGIPTPRSRQVSSPDEAAAAARAIGFPVVMKTDEPSISHKSDVGGVVLGVTSAAAAASAYGDLAARLGSRVVVSATAPEGVELALGVVRDPGLGPLVVLGAGGVLVEVLADRVVRLAPLDEEQALSGLACLRARRCCSTASGGPVPPTGTRWLRPSSPSPIWRSTWSTRSTRSMSTLFVADLGGAWPSTSSSRSGATAWASDQGQRGRLAPGLTAPSRSWGTAVRSDRGRGG